MTDRAPELYGIPISELARICGVTIKTARRWKHAQTAPPESALRLLRADLGCLDPAWSGWVVRRGELISPEGWQITINDVLGAPLRRFQLEAYKSENRELKRKWNAYDEQPLPGELPDIIRVVG